MALSQSQKDALRARRNTNTVEPAENVSRETPQEPFFDPPTQEQDVYNDVDLDEDIHPAVNHQHRGLVVHEEESIEIIPGFSFAPGMSFAERKKLVQQITGITGAPSEKVDEYLGIPIPCTGVLMHPCKVRSKFERIDRETGEAYYPLMPATRVVFVRNDNAKMLSFVSAAVCEFVRTYILPVFGAGPWEEPIVFKFRQVATNNGGRTYQAQVVE